MVRCLSTATVLAVLLVRPAAWAASRVEARVRPDRATISNAFLSLEFSLAAGRVRTVLIRNLRAATAGPVEGEDFSLEFASGRTVKAGDFQLVSSSVEPAGPEGRRLVFEVLHEGLRVRAITELHAEEWWAARWLEIEGGADRLTGISLARWRSTAATGPGGPGVRVGNLGFPSGCGQAVYSKDVFFAIAHPGAENLAADGFISCHIPAYDDLSRRKRVRTRTLVIGAGEAGSARHAFLEYIGATRAVPARMIFLVNDWYWKDKSRPLEAIEALARVKRATGVPINSFTLDDGWDFDWDEATGIWGRLNRKRFPGGWDSLEAAARPAGMRISLWFGPIGGYRYRPKRIEFARTVGFEINGDRLCLAGSRYRAHAVECFSRWAARGMDYIKVDGFWPDCQQPDHGHPTGPGGAIAQMDALLDVFAAWRHARPDLLIGYTSGSNPSPFWLQHADFIWRGGADDSHAGEGEPFDRHNTFIDTCLQAHRGTEVPVSAFVTFDVVQNRISGNRDDVFERGAWWLAARTSLHHDWYVQATDLSPERWKTLDRAARWGRTHEKLFQYGRMVGGDPGKGEIYGFSAFDKAGGTLALRNPSAGPRRLGVTLASLVDLPQALRTRTLILRGVYGETRALEGAHLPDAALDINLSPFAVAVLEIR